MNLFGQLAFFVIIIWFTLNGLYDRGKGEKVAGMLWILGALGALMFAITMAQFGRG